MDIILPNGVNEIINMFFENGYEAYAVGGCIRDYLMGRRPKDWDIASNAKPQKIMEIFKEYTVIPTGLKHGTVTIIFNNIPYEVTTYRIEGEYIDSRRPSKVEFIEDITMDLSRRDFTINAMAYNKINGLIDPFDGRKDIESKIIRCVGNPNKRFNEDALRMLRAVRFSSELGFYIDRATRNSIKKNFHLLSNISKERITSEFNKILLSPKPSLGLKELISTDLIEYIIPEIKKTVGFEQHNPYHDKDVFQHTICVVDNVECDKVLRLGALLHDIAKPLCFSMDHEGIGHFYKHHSEGMEMANNILRRLKYDNQTIKDVKALVGEHMCRINEMTKKGVKRLIGRIGEENTFKLFKLQIADVMCSNKPKDISNILRMKELAEKIIYEKEPISTKDLAVNGHDLIKLGINQGKEIGLILNELLDMVIENPKLNNKEVLMKEVKKIREKSWENEYIEDK